MKRSPTPQPTGLFDDVAAKYLSNEGAWQFYPGAPHPDNPPVRAVYRRSALDRTHALVVLRDVKQLPVARLVVPHEDLSEAERETMLQSLLSLFLITTFPKSE